MSIVDSVFEAVTNDWVATFEESKNQNGFMWRMAAQDTLPEGVNPNDNRVVGLCWLSRLHSAVAAERERCAKIAAEMDFEQAPDGYSLTAPGLEGLVADWERQQGFHADKIARIIREG